MSESNPSNINEIQSLALAASAPKTAGNAGLPFVLVPSGYTAAPTERTLPAPFRKRGEVKVCRMEDFVRLVLDEVVQVEDGTLSAYEIFTDLEAKTFTAILNWGSWRDQRIEFGIRHSIHFTMLKEAMEKVRGQRDLIKFLEDFAYLVTAPDSAALLEVAKKFKATQNVRFTAVQETANGNCNFEFVKVNEAGNADAKGQIQKVPEEFEVTVPIFEGEEPSKLTVRLGYDINEGKLTFGLSFFRLHLEIQRLAHARMADLSSKLNGKELNVGSAEKINPITSI